MKHLKPYNHYILESVGIDDSEINRIKSQLGKYPTLNEFVNSIDRLVVLYNKQGLQPSDLRPGINDLFGIQTKDKMAIYSFLKVVGKRGDVEPEVLNFFNEYDDYLKTNQDLYDWANGVLFNYDTFLKETFKKSLDMDKFRLESTELFK